MTIIFSVKHQILEKSPSQYNQKIYSNAKNYLKARFNFQTKDWEAASFKYALFTQNGKTYKKILGSEDGVQENECFIPNEVLAPGTFSVSVFGGDLITSSPTIVQVEDSGYTEKIENEKITPSTQEQINNLMYKYSFLCNQILKECQKIEKTIKKEEK